MSEHTSRRSGCGIRFSIWLAGGFWRGCLTFLTFLIVIVGYGMTGDETGLALAALGSSELPASMPSSTAVRPVFRSLYPLLNGPKAVSTQALTTTSSASKHSMPNPTKSSASVVDPPAEAPSVEQADVYGVVVSVSSGGTAPASGVLPHASEREVVQKVVVRLTSETPQEDMKRHTIVVDNVLGDNPAYNIQVVPGARVLLNTEKDPVSGKWRFYLANRDRTPALMILGTLFVMAVLLLGGAEVTKHGLLIVLLLVGCYKALFPALLAETTGPYWILLMCFAFTILGSFIYQTPGMRYFNREQSVVVLGSLGGLAILTGILWVMHLISPLNGFSHEGLASLWYRSRRVDYLSLWFASGIIGFQGFLFYLCWMLAQNRRQEEVLSFGQRFEVVMQRGRRLLGPLISSLGLLFLGLYMPILLILEGTPTAQFVNQESTASLLVFAFAGGLTLMLTVPLTALLAAWLLSQPSQPLGREK